MIIFYILFRGRLTFKHPAVYFSLDDDDDDDDDEYSEADVDSRRRLWSTSLSPLIVPIRRFLPLVTAPSMWQPRAPGTACRLVSRRHHLCPRPGASSTHYFVPQAIATASTAHDKLFSSCAANSVLTLLGVLAFVWTLRHLNQFFDE